MHAENEQYVEVTVEDGVGTLTLDRPGVNVLHIPMLQQMESALGELAANPEVRLLLLRARGKLFSGGVDVADHTPEKVGDMIPLFDRVCRALSEFPTPTLAVVHGHALGGGCELVLCCDLAVMAEGARIGQPEIQLAALAPVAALRLPALIGYRAAADLLFTGRALEAQEARQMGLVNAVVAPAELESWVQQQVDHLLGLSRAALVLLKQALRLGYGDWTHNLARMERLYLEDLMQTADAHEGLAAFLEKRSPVWKHS